jgi:hypothetical protein
MKKPKHAVAPLAFTIFFAVATCTLATDSQPQKSPLNSSMDVQEDASTYSVRLAVPETTDVNVRLAGSTLILDSGASASGIRHEQRVTLPKAQANAALGVKRAGGQLVISIPKGEPGTAGAIQNLPPSITLDGGFDALRDQVLSQAANMLQQMKSEENSAGGAAPALPPSPRSRPAMSA